MVYLTSFTVFSGDIKKKKKKKKSSENDQWITGHFQSFFILFFCPPDPKSEEKNPINQLIKKFGHYIKFLFPQLGLYIVDKKLVT